MDCPYCGSDVVDYLGMDDGGGDYGEAVCESWECLDCGAHFDGDCIGQAIDGNFFDEGETGITSPNTGPVGSDDVGDIPF